MWTRFVRFVFPALEPRRYRRRVMSGRKEPAEFLRLWDETFENTSNELATLSEPQIEEAAELAEKAFEAELKRKDTLEAKAATFVSSPTIATVITAAAAVMTWKQHEAWLSVTLVSLHLLALVHLTLSTYFAVAARAEEPFIVNNAANAILLSAAPQQDRVAARLAFARMNEPLLVMKVNNLALAETYFIRGLFIVAGVVVVTAIGWAIA